jgi:hypothetical protein
MWILGIIASSVLKKITDTFTRTVSGSLGTTDTGQVWNALRGTWFANGSAAQSNNAGTDYAIASLPLNQNVTVNADTTGGCGPSFWITDSGSWWGAFPHYSSSTSTTCTGATAYCYSAGCTPANSCGAISESIDSSCTGPTVSCSDTTNTCNPGGCGTVSVSSVVYSSFYAENDTPCSDLTGATSVPCSFCGTTGTPGNCSSTPGRYCCFFAGYTQYTRTQNTTVTTYTRSSATNETTTTYTSAARIISSASGTVSTDSTTTLATSTSSYPNIASMQVNTNGTTITVKGYSSAGQTTQLGTTITRTPTSPTRGTSVGIIKAPTIANQGSTLDNFNATT